MTRMEPFRERQAGQLSGGMKQKLALMCTLLHRPEMLFLDEPTNGVDPVSRRDFWAILYQLLKDGITIFMTTAYLDEAERCNRVGLMHNGRLIRCEAPGRDEARDRQRDPGGGVSSETISEGAQSERVEIHDLVKTLRLVHGGGPCSLRSPRARSSGFSGPTGRASRPRSGSSAGC